MLSIYNNKQKICLDKIIRDHGCPFYMTNNFRYVITLPAASEIMVAQASQTLGSYTLEDLQLEYEAIDNMDIAHELSTLYSVGRSLTYEHVTLMKTVVWAAASTLLNEDQ